MFNNIGWMKRINKWQFIGLLLSLSWLVGSLLYEYNSFTTAATKFSDWGYSICTKNLELGKVTDLTSCNLEKQKKFDLYMNGAWSNAFFLALFPLPFFWIYGFIVLNVSRAFSIGSKVIFNLDGFTKLKKSIYYFSYGFCYLTLFFFVVAAMNLYVTSKVPVSLGYEASVTVTDGYVTAEGTWTTNKLKDNSSTILFPQQTSKIVCRLEKRECIESRAIVSTTGDSPYLMSDLIEYDIKSWSKDSIVFVKSGICYDEIYTLDLNSKTVNGVEKFSNHAASNSYCVKPSSSHVNTTYRLDNGYAVYTRLKREASPWLLKVIFSIFGN
jgi:hypothetical protein